MAAALGLAQFEKLPAMVKARVAKLSGTKAAGAAQAHLRYLQRDGVTREGEQGRFYSAFSDDADFSKPGTPKLLLR